MSQTQVETPIATPFNGYDGISTTNQQDSPDEYMQLKEAGFSDDEIRGYIRPKLEEAGFADQEINAYFNSYQIAEGKQQVNLQASLSAYFQHGLQSSVAGLWAREKLPDALTADQQAEAGWLERLTMSTGQLIGDLPAIVGGGALGSLGGPAAPVTIPASAMAITEGLRASYMARIKEGHTEDFFYLSSLPNVLKAAGKGGVVGAATGGSGVLVNKAAMALGAGVKTAAAAGVGAEIATMPTAGAAMEGRLPHPQEFVDAALFIGTIRGVKAGMSQTQALVPKLRDIYAKTGKTPSEVAKAAQENQTVMQDLLSENKIVPEAFATEVLEKLKNGLYVTEEELNAYKETPWAQAAFNERSKPEVVQTKLSNLYDNAINNKELSSMEAWGFIDNNEAARISQSTGIDIDSGFTHTIKASEIRHALKRHGEGAETSENQIPITQEDIARIPEIVRSEDTIIEKGETTKSGLPAIIYKKEYPDGTTIYVEEIREGKKQLGFKSLWKTKRSSENDRNAPSLYAQDDTGMNRVAVFDKNVEQKDAVVNTQSETTKEPHLTESGEKTPEPVSEQPDLSGVSDLPFVNVSDRPLGEEALPISLCGTAEDQQAFRNLGLVKEFKTEPDPETGEVRTFEGVSSEVLWAERKRRQGVPQTASENSPEVMNRTGGDTSIPVDPNKPVIPPNGVLNHEDAVSLSSVVDDIAKALDVPIRTGKMGPSGRGALGIFKVKPEVIRTKIANDVATIMHEAGHFIQKALFGDISWKPLAPFRAELAPIATKARNGQSNLPEGFAEFVAKYVCNPQEAQRVAPKFYEHFEALLQEKSPEFQKALLNAREAVRKWADQPAALEVLSHVNIEGRQNEGLLARLLSRDSWDRLYTNFIDRLYPLRKVTDIMAQGQELSPDMNPYILARTFAGAKGKATHFIEHSPFEFGTWKNVGKPLAEILRSADNLDDFRAYLVSRRGLELEARGIKSGIRKEAMDATVKQFEKKYGGLAKELDEYQDHLVKYLVDSGVLSKEAAKAMRDMNKSYVPFFRVMEKDTGFLGNAGKTLTARNPVKRIKGSGRDIIDPLESIIKNTYAMVEAAEKNAIGRALTDLAAKTEGSGWLVEKLPAPKEAVKVSREEVNRAFLESLGDIDPAMKKTLESIVKSGAVDDMVTFWQDASMLDKKSQIAVYRDGKRQVYQVAPELAEVMNGLNAETVPLLVKLVAAPAKLLRAGATLTPDFMVRNMIRDAVSAGVVSRSGFIPGLDTARGLKRAITKDDTYWNWVKAGGDQASLVSMDRTTLQNTVKDIAATGYLDRVWNVVKNPIEVLRLGSEMSEKMTRLGEFGKAVERNGSDKAGLMQAAYEARDLMDFSRRGRLTNSFNVMTAFFNASVQGLDRTARGFKENPRRFVIRAALFIGIPSIINAIRNYGDEDIAQVPRAQRDLFWCVPIGEGAGKTILRIPKPFEQGVMFGSTLERTVEFLMDAYTKKYGGDINKARQEAFRGLGASIFDVSLPNTVPTAFAPLIEHFANRSIPFDRPIVPADREGLLPEYQYAPYTTELTKVLSHYVGVLPPFNEMQTFSPARAENYVRGWTGGMGMYVLQLLDAMGRNANLLPDPVKPADTLADIPFVRAFVVRNPSMGAESIQRFYDSYNQAHSYLRTINALKKDYKFEDVANLLPYSAYQAMEGPKRTLSDLTKTISLIYKSPDMSADQKRQMIDALYFRAVETAKLGNMVFEALQPDIERLKKRAEK